MYFQAKRCNGSFAKRVDGLWKDVTEESYLLFGWILILTLGGGRGGAVLGRRRLFNWLDANVLFQFCKVGSHQHSHSWVWGRQVTQSQKKKKKTCHCFWTGWGRGLSKTSPEAVHPHHSAWLLHTGPTDNISLYVSLSAEQLRPVLRRETRKSNFANFS